MQLAKFNAVCPFEIGDKIKTRRRVSAGEAAAIVEKVHTITDIVCMHSVRDRKVEFLYELDGHGPLVRLADPARQK